MVVKDPAAGGQGWWRYVARDRGLLGTVLPGLRAGDGHLREPGPGAACGGRSLIKHQLRHLTQIWIKAFFLYQAELIIHMYS